MKKLIAMLLVLVMALSMTACGGSDAPAAPSPHNLATSLFSVSVCCPPSWLVTSMKSL